MSRSTVARAAAARGAARHRLRRQRSSGRADHRGGRAARATAPDRAGQHLAAPTISWRVHSRPRCAPSRTQWLQGDLDHLEAVVFARGDDSGQRLYYYLCELQRRGLCARTPAAALRRGQPRATDELRAHPRLDATARRSNWAARRCKLGAALQRVRRREELLRMPCGRVALLPAPLRGKRRLVVRIRRRLRLA